MTVIVGVSVSMVNTPQSINAYILKQKIRKANLLVPHTTIPSQFEENTVKLSSHYFYLLYLDFISIIFIFPKIDEFCII